MSALFTVTRTLNYISLSVGRARQLVYRYSSCSVFLVNSISLHPDGGFTGIVRIMNLKTDTSSAAIVSSEAVEVYKCFG